jgi:hypothetical protein
MPIQRLRLIKALTLMTLLERFRTLVSLLRLEHPKAAHLQTGESH